jgi:hypothetical protein
LLQEHHTRLHDRLKDINQMNLKGEASFWNDVMFSTKNLDLKKAL